MKFLLGILFICIAVKFSSANSTFDALKIGFFAADDYCNCKHGMSAGDYISHETVTRAGKCFLACLMKATHKMTSDNKFNKESFMDRIVYHNAILKMSAKDLNRCVDVTDEDECEAAYKIDKCLLAGYEAYEKVHKIY